MAVPEYEEVKQYEKNYSFLGVNPLLTLCCKDHAVTVRRGRESETAAEQGDAMDVRRYLREYRAPVLEGMPGFVGYFSYEMIGYLEPELHLPQSGGNDYELMLFDKVIAYDHLKQKICLVANYETEKGEEGSRQAETELEQLLYLIASPAVLSKPQMTGIPEFHCNLTKNSTVPWWKEQNSISGKEIFFRVLFQEDLKRNIKALC